MGQAACHRDFFRFFFAIPSLLLPCDDTVFATKYLLQPSNPFYRIELVFFLALIPFLFLSFRSSASSPWPPPRPAARSSSRCTTPRSSSPSPPGCRSRADPHSSRPGGQTPTSSRRRARKTFDREYEGRATCCQS